MLNKALQLVTSSQDSIFTVLVEHMSSSGRDCYGFKQGVPGISIRVGDISPASFKGLEITEFMAYMGRRTSEGTTSSYFNLHFAEDTSYWAEIKITELSSGEYVLVHPVGDGDLFRSDSYSESFPFGSVMSAAFRNELEFKIEVTVDYS